MTIFTNLAFVAKNQRLESNPPLVIRSLRSFIASQEEPDNKLCPVRALLYYLKRTQARCGNLTIQALARFRLKVDQVGGSQADLQFCR